MRAGAVAQETECRSEEQPQDLVSERRSRRKTYGDGDRSMGSTDSVGGYRAESQSLGGHSSAFDAELAALVRAIEICALDAREGVTFRIFTDSQAAMR